MVHAYCASIQKTPSGGAWSIWIQPWQCIETRCEGEEKKRKRGRRKKKLEEVEKGAVGEESLC